MSFSSNARLTAFAPAMVLAILVESLPTPLRAQSTAGSTPASSKASGVARELARGVTYRYQRDARGPWDIHVVEIDLRRADIEVRGVRANDQLQGREKTSEMAKRASAAGARVLAAINADFFNLQTGENENNQVIAGEWWKGLKVTDSPYDTYDNVHVQFAMDSTLHPAIERFIFDGRAWVRGAVTPIITVNANPSGKPEGTALYTSRFGAATPRDTSRQTAEAALEAAGRRADTLLYVRRGPVSTSSGSAIPQGGAVLAAYGARTPEVQGMADGDTVRIVLTSLPRLRGGAPNVIIGGWPRIVRDGVNVASDAATVEGTISRNAEVRHPRSAIGYSRDGRRLWLVVVDGRSTISVGMTLVELAEYMRTLGVWQGMNFDGGGSTTMVIDGEVVNKPSDPVGERAVGNALLIVRRDTSFHR